MTSCIGYAEQFNPRETFPAKFILKHGLGINFWFINFAQVGRGQAALTRSPASMGVFKSPWANGCKVSLRKRNHTLA
jgi:hypothetical protein